MSSRQRTYSWNSLDQELALWAQDGRVLPLWWRDDDATAPSKALTQLANLSNTFGLPVHLAVIPKLATNALADTLDTAFVPVVHGWSHDSHAPYDQKKAEFGDHRPTSVTLHEAQAGLARLTELFGDRLQPMFVPPWNRIGPDVTAALGALGYRAVSTFTPRNTQWAAPGLHQINTHLDVIDWRGSRSLADPQGLIDQLTRQLGDRRAGAADATEPYGILTHHLVHDPAIWDFTEELIERLLAGPAKPWRFSTTAPNSTLLNARTVS